MILYDAEDTASLEAYGIQIPVHKSKAAGTLEVLRSHPLLEKILLDRCHLI